MPNTIYVRSRGPEDWRQRLANPELHWRDGYSAKEAAQAWENAGQIPREIADLVGPVKETMLILSEHQVPMPGRGGASQNDVFVFLRNTQGPMAMAVEAKVSEPFDKAVGQWLSDGSANKNLRLSKICDLLGKPGNAPEHLYYQLFHRTASAVIEARRYGFQQAAMIVQSFSSDHKWLDAFCEFSSWLGASAGLNQAGTVRLPDGLSLTLGWADCSAPDAEHK